METIGQRMKALREENHLSQSKVAKMCGSNQATIGKMEAGKTLPSVKVLVWWADYFDVSLDYLCCRIDQPQGKLYDCKPKANAEKEEMRRFIDMCFDPDSPMIGKLKDALYQIMENEK